MKHRRTYSTPPQQTHGECLRINTCNYARYAKTCRKNVSLHRQTIGYEPAFYILHSATLLVVSGYGKPNLCGGTSDNLPVLSGYGGPLLCGGTSPAHLRRATSAVQPPRYRALQTYGLRPLRLPQANCSLLSVPCSLDRRNPCPASAPHSSFFILHSELDFHLLRQRTRPGNRFKLLWFTVLQLRLEHLVERGPHE